ncbi:hypothetical protein FIBSPDRAFT_897140 [Athelia psychrophila]|uniref:Uncharacterized protein n=1 Tax=Athelia psychrophila TaxID=1759441 RepID=A0A166CIS5_9AGAM|nr:hypothetical protein FIBSPDRAFT_897140 [Fibularhizoctonia sp. CBS 109695]
MCTAGRSYAVANVLTLREVRRVGGGTVNGVRCEPSVVEAVDSATTEADRSYDGWSVPGSHKPHHEGDGAEVGRGAGSGPNTTDVSVSVTHRAGHSTVACSGSVAQGAGPSYGAFRGGTAREAYREGGGTATDVGSGPGTAITPETYRQGGREARDARCVPNTLAISGCDTRTVARSYATSPRSTTREGYGRGGEEVRDTGSGPNRAVVSGSATRTADCSYLPLTSAATPEVCLWGRRVARDVGCEPKRTAPWDSAARKAGRLCAVSSGVVARVTRRGGSGSGRGAGCGRATTVFSDSDIRGVDRLYDILLV